MHFLLFQKAHTRVGPNLNLTLAFYQISLNDKINVSSALIQRLLKPARSIQLQLICQF